MLTAGAVELLTTGTDDGLRTASTASAAAPTAASAATAAASSGVLLLMEFDIHRPVADAGDRRIVHDDVALTIKLQLVHVDCVDIKTGVANLLSTTTADVGLSRSVGGLIHGTDDLLLLLLIRRTSPTAAAAAAGWAGGGVCGAGAAADGVDGAAARPAAGRRS